jgi:hypothetical protein
MTSMRPPSRSTALGRQTNVTHQELVIAFSIVGVAAGLYVWVDSVLGLVAGAAAAAYLGRASPRGLLCVIFALAPFNQNVAALPVNLAAADLMAMAALPVAAIGRWGRLLVLGQSPVWRPIGAYLLFCTASILLGSFDADGVVSVLQMLVYLIAVPLLAALLVKSPDDLVPAFWSLICSTALIAVALMIVGPGYVLNLHKNAAGSSLCMALVAAIAMLLARPGARRVQWPLVAMTLVLGFGLLWSLSRGAWLGAAVAVIVLLGATRRLRVLIALVAPLAVTLFAGWKLLPEEKRTYASDVSFEAYNIKERFKSFDYAYAQFSREPLWGVGVGFRKTYDATNVVMSTLAETGLVGLALFLAVFAALGWVVWRSSRRGGLRAEAPFPIAIGAALIFAKLAHGMVDQFWARGSFAAWFGAGLIIMGATPLGASWWAGHRPAVGTAAGRQDGRRRPGRGTARPLLSPNLGDP